MPASALIEASNLSERAACAAARSRRRGRKSKRRGARRAQRARRARRAPRRCGPRLLVRASRETRQQLIVRGQANLIGDLRAEDDLERIRTLFADLETKTDVIDLLHRAENGEGVKIFIGSENKLFSLSGSSMIAAPLRDGDQRDRRRARRHRPDALELRTNRAHGGIRRAGARRPQAARAEGAVRRSASARSASCKGETTHVETLRDGEKFPLGSAALGARAPFERACAAKWASIDGCLRGDLLVVLLGVRSPCSSRLIATIATVTLNGVLFLIGGAAEIGIGMHRAGMGPVFPLGDRRSALSGCSA